MFTLYFGAFDVLLYTVAFLVALYVSQVLCNQMDAADAMETVSASAISVSEESMPVNTQAAVVVVAQSVETGPVDTNISAVYSVASSDAILQQSIKPVLDVSESDQSVVLQKSSPIVEEKPVLDLSTIKLFKLRNESVVRLCDLVCSVPDSIRRYKLRKQPVVRLQDLETFAVVVT